MATELRVIFNHFPAIQAKLRPAVGQAIRKSLFDAQAIIQQGMASSSSPSAPGEMPAVVASDLVNSLTVDDTRIGELHGELSADGGHAIYLEMGTVRMAPRPFLQPAGQQIVAPLEAAIVAIVESGL